MVSLALHEPYVHAGRMWPAGRRFPTPALASVSIFEVFQVFAQCFSIAKIFVSLKQLFH